jgi:hypothetical protein
MDYFGNSIPANGAYDVGAAEYGGGPPPPPTDTPVPTDTPEPVPTDTPGGPTDTPAPPTDTPIPPTDTPVPPTDTPAPTNTPGSGGNLALNQPATASSVEGSQWPPGAAVDGDPVSYWRSEFGSKLAAEWIRVDLGAAYDVSHVVLDWDSNYAIVYSVDVSLNDADWTTVYSTSSGNGGVDDITFGVISARYVRMYSTDWNHAKARCKLDEFEVYE